MTSSTFLAYLRGTQPLKERHFAFRNSLSVRLRVSYQLVLAAHSRATNDKYIKSCEMETWSHLQCSVSDKL